MSKPTCVGSRMIRSCGSCSLAAAYAAVASAAAFSPALPFTADFATDSAPEFAADCGSQLHPARHFRDCEDGILLLHAAAGAAGLERASDESLGLGGAGTIAGPVKCRLGEDGSAGDDRLFEERERP